MASSSGGSEIASSYEDLTLEEAAAKIKELVQVLQRILRSSNKPIKKDSSEFLTCEGILKTGRAFLHEVYIAQRTRGINPPPPRILPAATPTHIPPHIKENNLRRQICIQSYTAQKCRQYFAKDEDLTSQQRELYTICGKHFQSVKTSSVAEKVVVNLSEEADEEVTSLKKKIKKMIAHLRDISVYEKRNPDGTLRVHNADEMNAFVFDGVCFVPMAQHLLRTQMLHDLVFTLINRVRIRVTTPQNPHISINSDENGNYTLEYSTILDGKKELKLERNTRYDITSALLISKRYLSNPENCFNIRMMPFFVAACRLMMFAPYMEPAHIQCEEMKRLEWNKYIKNIFDILMLDSKEISKLANLPSVSYLPKKSLAHILKVGEKGRKKKHAILMLQYIHREIRWILETAPEGTKYEHIPELDEQGGDYYDSGDENDEDYALPHFDDSNYSGVMNMVKEMYHTFDPSAIMHENLDRAMFLAGNGHVKSPMPKNASPARREQIDRPVSSGEHILLSLLASFQYVSVYDKMNLEEFTMEAFTKAREADIEQREADDPDYVVKRPRNSIFKNTEDMRPVLPRGHKDPRFGNAVPYGFDRVARYICQEVAEVVQPKVLLPGQVDIAGDATNTTEEEAILDNEFLQRIADRQTHHLAQKVPVGKIDLPPLIAPPIATERAGTPDATAAAETASDPALALNGHIPAESAALGEPVQIEEVVESVAEGSEPGLNDLTEPPGQSIPEQLVEMVDVGTNTIDVPMGDFQGDVSDEEADKLCDAPEFNDSYPEESRLEISRGEVRHIIMMEKYYPKGMDPKLTADPIEARDDKRSSFSREVYGTFRSYYQSCRNLDSKEKFYPRMQKIPDLIIKVSKVMKYGFSNEMVVDGVDYPEMEQNIVENWKNYHLGESVWAKWRGEFWPARVIGFERSSNKVRIVWDSDPFAMYVDQFDVLPFDFGFHLGFNPHYGEIMVREHYLDTVANAIVTKGIVGYWEEFLTKGLYMGLFKNHNFRKITCHLPPSVHRHFKIGTFSPETDAIIRQTLSGKTTASNQFRSSQYYKKNFAESNCLLEMHQMHVFLLRTENMEVPAQHGHTLKQMRDQLWQNVQAFSRIASIEAGDDRLVNFMKDGVHGLLATPGIFEKGFESANIVFSNDIAQALQVAESHDRRRKEGAQSAPNKQIAPRSAQRGGRKRR